MRPAHSSPSPQPSPRSMRGEGSQASIAHTRDPGQSRIRLARLFSMISLSRRHLCVSRSPDNRCGGRVHISHHPIHVLRRFKPCVDSTFKSLFVIPGDGCHGFPGRRKFERLIAARLNSRSTHHVASRRFGIAHSPPAIRPAICFALT
jgi:hypothetical protein